MDRKGLWTAVVVAGWLAMLGAGFQQLWSYSARPGESGVEASRWPHQARTPFDGARGNLVVFLHPRCPCSRATLTELERLIPRLRGGAAVTILFVRPPGMPVEWERGALWSRASQIPGVFVAADEGGREAALFGAATSGLAVFYGKDGRLLYRGGLTFARGHEGPNAGVEAVAAAAAGLAGPSDIFRRPAFGCALQTRRHS